jgi:hypothetical protein
VGAPSATVGDSPDFLDIDVDHVPSPFRDNRLRLAIRVTVGVDELAAVQPELISPRRAPGARPTPVAESRRFAVRAVRPAALWCGPRTSDR